MEIPRVIPLQCTSISALFNKVMALLTTTKKGIQIIPTQVIYDANFKELTRHEGFATEEAIKDLVETAKQALASHP